VNTRSRYYRIRKDIDMCRCIGKHSGADSDETADSLFANVSVSASESDRAVVLNIFTEFARTGLGVLEEIPGLGPQFFSLRSGEVFWLHANGITRIK
jgi:hypothetical protein